MACSAADIIKGEDRDERFIVSIGMFNTEQGAVARRKAGLDAGLKTDIIDTKDDRLTNIYAAILLLCDTVKKLGDKLDNSITILSEQYAFSCGELTTEPVAKQEAPRKTVAQLLKERRKLKGYSQAELGEIIYSSGKVISNYENGKTIPPQKLKALMKILQITDEELEACGNG